MLDIPADRGLGFGAFDHAGPEGDAAALSKAMKLAAQSNYGTAGLEFVRRLIGENIDGDAVRALVSDFVAAEIPAGADGQVSRAAERLGLIMAAGELATALGVTPWQRGAAREAAAWALRQWIAGRGGTEPAEVRQAVEAVRLIIQQHGQSRFEPLDDDGDREARLVNNRLGWRTGSGPDAQWLIPSEVWRSEVCAGLDFKFVILNSLPRRLASAGCSKVRATDGNQSDASEGGQRAFMWCLLPSSRERAMALNLSELRSIARGEQSGEIGRYGVARRSATPSVTPKKPGVTPVTPATPQICKFGKDEIRGVAEGVAAALRLPLEGREAREAGAESRNRAAAAAGLSDRFCSCGTMATVAVGSFRPDAGNPEGVARWLCSECFETERT